MPSYPKYKCSKVVEAFKIKHVEVIPRPDDTPNDIILHPFEEWLKPIRMAGSWAERFQPQPHGYFVRYKDGYESFSPEEAFEEGYNINKRSENQFKKAFGEDEVANILKPAVADEE